MPTSIESVWLGEVRIYAPCKDFASRAFWICIEAALVGGRDAATIAIISALIQGAKSAAETVD